jgi:hypothetical protein
MKAIYAYVLTLLILPYSNSFCQERKVASIEEVLTHIEKSSNPYEVLGASPSSTNIQFDTQTHKMIERVTGWDWWTLSRMVDEGTIQHELTALTETQANSIKKIFDSRTLIRKLHERKGLRLKLGPWEWQIGAKDARKLAIDELRDIQIYLENDLGFFHVKWTRMDDKTIKLGGSTVKLPPTEGYLTSFRPKAKNPDLQNEFESLRNDLKKNKARLQSQYPDGIPIKEQMKMLSQSEKIFKLSATEFGDSRVLTMSSKLSKELDSRLAAPGTPTTKALLESLSAFSTESCARVFLPRR